MIELIEKKIYTLYVNLTYYMDYDIKY